jgi:hypothetical protein
MRSATAIAMVVTGCFSPAAHRGQPCESWCPPPESCVAGTCQVAPSDDAIAPIQGNYVFVTSEAKAPGGLGGPTGGDDWCNQLAHASGLPGHYTAWLSSSTQSARQRLEATGARGWYRPDGKPFADTLDDIAIGKMFYPLRVAETGADIGEVETDAVAATGTFEDGSDATSDCGGFTSMTAVTELGYIDGGRMLWTAGLPSTDCSTPARIYCFGDSENRFPVAPPAPTGMRLAFITQAPIVMTSMGRAGIDAACQAEATNAGKSGTFVAWLPLVGEGAKARLAKTTPWARDDGVIALLEDGATMVAPIDLDLGGNYRYGAVWTGADNPTDPVRVLADDCYDWTTTSPPLYTYSGEMARGHAAFRSGTPFCSESLGVYCLEQ